MSIYPVIHSGFKDGKVMFSKKRDDATVSSLFLSGYFPVLEKSFMTGYMLMGEGCPLSGKRCCLTVLPKASVTAAGKLSHGF